MREYCVSVHSWGLQFCPLLDSVLSLGHKELTEIFLVAFNVYIWTYKTSFYQ